MKAGKKLSKTLRSLHDKIKDSKVVDNMPGEMAELKKKATVVEACTHLMSVMTKPPNPSEFLESVVLLHEAGATVSTNLHMMEFQQKIVWLLFLRLLDHFYQHHIKLLLIDTLLFELLLR